MSPIPHLNSQLSTLNPYLHNLYVHFPFCRRKCTYCVLHSRVGQTPSARAAYVSDLIHQLKAPLHNSTLNSPLSTLYFGGGSPALCDLRPLLDALAPLLGPDTEFTVELHPLDVTRDTLAALKAGGVTRVSMGLQSLDDAVLERMGRGHTFHEAERAFGLTKEFFDNAGIDLIVGYPGETSALSPRHARLAKWGLTHCSVYSLILEDGSQLAHQLKTGRIPSTDLPDDDTVLNRLSVVARFLGDLGLERYEISNYARPGCECRHNLATWHGEDYRGLGDGACGREGLTRTRGVRTTEGPVQYESETVSAEQDRKERTLFRLRTREGLSPTEFPEWIPILDAFVEEGLLVRLDKSETPVYRLTERGTEVCDTILAELV